MAVAVASENATVMSAVHCSPWVDYVETHEGDTSIGLVMFVNCVATILANTLLLVVIFSHEESKDQVRMLKRVIPMLTSFNRDPTCSCSQLADNLLADVSFADIYFADIYFADIYFADIHFADIYFADI